MHYTSVATLRFGSATKPACCLVVDQVDADGGLGTNY